MWLARYFPGLRIGPAEMAQMLPEETAALRKAGQKILDVEAEERLSHTKLLVTSNGARLR